MNIREMKISLKLLTILLLCFFLVATFYEESLADVQTGGVLNEVYAKYKEAASAWVSVIQSAATRLFWILATISMVWTFSQLLFHRSSLPELFGEMIRFLVFTGFYLWLLNNGPNIANDIINSMRELASQASGQPTVSPSSIVDVGFKIFDKACAGINVWSPIISAGCLITSGIILVVLALIGINMLLQLCSAWVLAYAGIFFLGFGGSKWTSDMAINYFKTVLGVGASLMTMVLLVGIGTSIITSYHEQMAGDMKLQELAILLVVSITLFLLADKLPSMVAGIITGSSVGASGGSSFVAGAAVGAAMTTGALASAAVSRLSGATLGTAANVAGAISAFKTARQTATEPGGSQGDMSMGNRSSVASEIGKGAMGVGKQAMDSARQGFAERAQNSLGGKIASAIKPDKE